METVSPVRVIDLFLKQKDLRKRT